MINKCDYKVNKVIRNWGIKGFTWFICCKLKNSSEMEVFEFKKMCLIFLKSIFFWVTHNCTVTLHLCRGLYYQPSDWLCSLQMLI